MKGQRVQNVFSSKPQTLNQDYLKTLNYLLQNLHLNKKKGYLLTQSRKPLFFSQRNLNVIGLLKHLFQFG